MKYKIGLCVIAINIAIGLNLYFKNINSKKIRYILTILAMILQNISMWELSYEIQSLGSLGKKTQNTLNALNTLGVQIATKK